MSHKPKIFTILLIILCALPLRGVGFAKVQAVSEGFRAEVVKQSLKSIPRLRPGEDFDFWVKYKNTGSKSWLGSGPVPVSLRTTTQTTSLYYHPSWYNLYTPLRLDRERTIKPGQEVVFSFTLRAPDTLGLHWQKFSLFAGSKEIFGSKIEIPIRVIAEAPSAPSGKFYWQVIPQEIEIEKAVPQISEPQIQVGLFYIEEDDKEELPIEIEAINNLPYEVRSSDGTLLARATEGDKLEVEFNFNIERYFLNHQGTRLLMTDTELNFVPSKENGVFQISSWENGPFWGKQVNDNLFAGKIRVHYNPSTERLWIINELPLEDYLLGICEVSDDWPFEFLKSQAIAARTYAYYRIVDPKYTNTPDKKPLFTLRSTQADQVYRGVKGKERNPNFGKAVLETRGVILTYKGDPILAYYFAQSDGRTRNSEEVHMTKEPVPYLKGKIDPPGQGRELRGHGVGLPQVSGMIAASQGANFSQILKYYYTGVELTKIY